MNAKTALVSILAATLSVGCAGRRANPVTIHQYGDDRKSCLSLEREMVFIEGEIQNLIPQTDKTTKNTVLGVTGFFLIVPLFFMDLSKAEQMEIDAFRRRYNHLVILADEKQCGVERTEIPAFDQPTEDAADEDTE